MRQMHITLLASVVTMFGAATLLSQPPAHRRSQNCDNHGWAVPLSDHGGVCFSSNAALADWCSDMLSTHFGLACTAQAPPS